MVLCIMVSVVDCLRNNRFVSVIKTSRSVRYVESQKLTSGNTVCVLSNCGPPFHICFVGVKQRGRQIFEVQSGVHILRLFGEATKLLPSITISHCLLSFSVDKFTQPTRSVNLNTPFFPRGVKKI